MNVHLIVPSYNNPASTVDCVRSAIETTMDAPFETTIHLFNHWEKDMGAAICASIQDRNPLFVRLYNYRQNRGLAKSWNDGIRMALAEGADVIVIANADIRFGPGSLAQLVKTAYEFRTERPITFVSGHHGKNGRDESFGHSLFAITPTFVKRLGYWDQNFKKAYYEDSDMDRRRARAGVLSADAGVLDVYHEGSESIYLSSPEEEAAIRLQQDANRRYYYQKWGKNEEYPCPFDLERPPWLPNKNWGQDLQETLMRIEWENREDPYPGFGLPDPPAVRL